MPDGAPRPNSACWSEPEPGLLHASTQHDELSVLVVLGLAIALAVALAFTAATVFVALHIRLLAVFTAPPMIGAWLLAGIFGRELCMRARRMGAFTLDARRRMLVREGPDLAMPILRIRPSTCFAPSFGRMEASWWVLVETAGATFRFARGSWSEVRPLLMRLAELGLRVEGLDDERVLHTRGLSVFLRGPARFEFDCRERLAKVIAPLVVAFWIGLAALLSAGFILGARRGQVAQGAAWFAVPLALFFGFGILLGLANAIAFYRRSGVFVVDLGTGALIRNGVTISQSDPVARFRMGQPTPFGLRRAGRLGPQVLAAELRSGRILHLVRGLPGEVRFAANLLREAGAAIEE